VVDRILEFQKGGGLVIGDANLCPAIQADFTLPIFQRQKDAAADKAQLLKLAAEVRTHLDGKYRRVVDTTSPNVVPHRRRAGAADYIFLVNDAREAGDYVGQYGLVHERGVPTTAEVQLTSNATAVYDLVAHRPVPFQRDAAGSLRIPMTLGPCDGRLLMAVPKAIAGLSVAGPEEVVRGQSWTGQIAVQDAEGKPLDAIIPLHVEIVDSEGRPSEFSGHYAAVKGTLELPLDIAANDQPGVWEVRVHELASGQSASKFFRVSQ
jgi:hypothetical protein